jgi:mannosyl-3-phosphoglycerate phosphatase family protein
MAMMNDDEKRKTIVFSDLDGTLLHSRTYSFEKAKPALILLQEMNVPLVLVSSKTRAELEVWRDRLGNHHPFIVENGGAIFIPKDYFPFQVDGVLQDGYRVVSLGKPYESIRRRFMSLRDGMNVAVRGFGDMTVEEVMDLTGLPHDDAMLARRREFSEPFVFARRTDETFLQAIEGAGLRWTRGRLFHIMGDHHKGRAVSILNRMYKQQFGRIETIGIGDGLNDLQFLLNVDQPVLVRKLSGMYEEQMRIPNLMRTSRVGPAGWNEAVTQLLGQNIRR